MGNYNPKITISSAPGITVNNLVVALAEATNPGVFVAFQVLPPPHTVSAQLVFIGLNPVMHNVKIFETPGSTPAGTIRANFALDPRYPSISLKLPVFIYAGTTAGFPSGGNTAVDATWIGWNARLEIRGVGPMDPATEATWDITTGTMTVDIPGYATGVGELWILTFDPLIITVTPLSSVTEAFSAVQLITVDTVLSSADVGKAFLVAAVAATAPIITLPDLATMPDSKPLYFMSQGGTHFNAILRTFSGGQLINYNGGRTDAYLGKSEEVWIFSYTNPFAVKSWLVMSADWGMKAAGEVVYQYNNFPINTTFADGTTRLRNQFPRLWYEVQQLDPSCVVSDATWLTGTANQGRYSSGDGSTTFRVPRLFTNGFLRAVDGSARKAGSTQADGVGAFTATIVGQRIQKAGNNNQIITIGNVNDANLGTVNASGVAIDGGTGETRPFNYGVYALIRT